MDCIPKHADSFGVVVGHFDHLLPATRYRNPHALGRGGHPTWFHPSSATDLSSVDALCGDNGPSRSPILSRHRDLRDPLPGGFPARPAKRACSLWPPLSWAFTGRYSSRSTRSQSFMVTTQAQPGTQSGAEDTQSFTERKRPGLPVMPCFSKEYSVCIRAISLSLWFSVSAPCNSV